MDKKSVFWILFVALFMMCASVYIFREWNWFAGFMATAITGFASGVATKKRTEQGDTIFKLLILMLALQIATSSILFLGGYWLTGAMQGVIGTLAIAFSFISGCDSETEKWSILSFVLSGSTPILAKITLHHRTLLIVLILLIPIIHGIIVYGMYFQNKKLKTGALWFALWAYLSVLASQSVLAREYESAGLGLSLFLFMFGMTLTALSYVGMDFIVSKKFQISKME